MWAVVSTASIPKSTAAEFFSTSPAVIFAASDAFAARRLTSLATTANPRPASPALAASTEALRDRILVRKAISSISDTMLLISSELRRIARMASSASSICLLHSFRLSPTWPATWLERTALSALC